MVYDIERGKAGDILPQPWQTDTCIGDWHYKRSRYETDGYKKSGDVIRMLVDIVSKNGNLMLNIPLRGDGSVDDKEVSLLEDLAAWMDQCRGHLRHPPLENLWRGSVHPDGSREGAV